MPYFLNFCVRDKVKGEGKFCIGCLQLIFVAYNADNDSSKTYQHWHALFCEKYDAIFAAEDALYGITDRHIQTEAVVSAENALQKAISDFQSLMPMVFDPFAGGGAIPLEAARLGCRSYGNDINPVAHIVEIGSATLPQKYGKTITYSKSEFLNLYGEAGVRLAEENNYTNGDGFTIPNRLSFDVEVFAKQLRQTVMDEVGYLYPKDAEGHTPIAYYWARTAKCSNPSCGAEVPLLKGFYLANTSKKKVFLNPIVDKEKKTIDFEIKEGTCNIEGWNNRGNLTCPCCGSITDVENVKNQSIKGGLKERFLAVISDTKNGKKYTIPTTECENIVNTIQTPDFIPSESMTRNSNGGDTFPWGITTYKQLFSNRQLFVLSAWLKHFNALKQALLGKYTDAEYAKAVVTYLAIWLDRIAIANTSFGVWHTGGEKLERIMGRQAIPMTFDYPESNTFCESSGSALNQLEWITRYLNTESGSSFPVKFQNSSSGDQLQFAEKELTAVVTDPPYYDAIAYADCSDFFYVWLKRTLGDLYPNNLSTPQTPKTEECTALKHHHLDDAGKPSKELANNHFEKKLTQIFDAIEKQTSDVVSIMFAHQSTEAWTTLCNSILDSRMNITGSWPLDTEMSGALKTDKAFLESSVTVSCCPSQRSGYGDFKSIEKEIKKNITAEVDKLYALGFRGADLLTACFGQAVSVFGKYETVEKADGSIVTVAELLELAKNAAFDALLLGIQGDDFTKFYIGWLQLNGIGQCDHDDATQFTRVGVNVDIHDILSRKILINEGKKDHLALAEEHLGGGHGANGTHPDDSLIDQAHRAILLNKAGDRRNLLHFIKVIAPEATDPLWRLLASLKELLPNCEDLTQVQNLLQNAEDLRQHCKDEDKQTEGGTFVFAEE